MDVEIVVGVDSLEVSSFAIPSSIEDEDLVTDGFEVTAIGAVIDAVGGGVQRGAAAIVDG